MASSCELCSPPTAPSPSRPARPSITPGDHVHAPARKIWVYKNGSQIDPLKAKRILIPGTWGKLLEEATRKLDLPFSARKLFTVDGDPITKLSWIDHNAHVVASTGEPFKPYVPTSPSSMNAPKAQVISPMKTSATQLLESKQSTSTKSPTTSPSPSKKKKTKRKQRRRGKPEVPKSVMSTQTDIKVDMETQTTPRTTSIIIPSDSTILSKQNEKRRFRVVKDNVIHNDESESTNNSSPRDLDNLPEILKSWPANEFLQKRNSLNQSNDQDSSFSESDSSEGEILEAELVDDSDDYSVIAEGGIIGHGQVIDMDDEDARDEVADDENEEFQDLAKRQMLLSHGTLYALQEGTLPARLKNTATVSPFGSFSKLQIPKITVDVQQQKTNTPSPAKRPDSASSTNRSNGSPKISNQWANGHALPVDSVTNSPKYQSMPPAYLPQTNQFVIYDTQLASDRSNMDVPSRSASVPYEGEYHDTTPKMDNSMLSHGNGAMETPKSQSPSQQRISPDRRSPNGTRKMWDNQQNEEELHQKFIEYFKSSRMEVDEFKSEARKLTWTRKIDDQNKLLLELVKTEEAIKEEWVWSIFGALRTEQISPTVNTDKLRFSSTLHKMAEKTLEHIRFTTGPDSHIRVRLAVVGPPKSGKTTHLFLLTRSLAYEFISNTQWKRTLVVPINWSNFLYDTEDALTFYYKMVDHVFDLIAGQLSTVAKHKKKLAAYFKQLPLQKYAPAIPVAPNFEYQAGPLQHVAETLQRAWSKPNSLSLFVTQICKLPVSIGELFDFKEFLFIFDDFDNTYQKSLRLSRNQELQTSESIHTYMKSVIKNHSYILAGQDSEVLYRSLESSTSADKVSLIRGLEFYSTYNTISKNEFLSEYPEMDVDIILKDDYGADQVISFEYFGGCASYLSNLVDILQDWKVARDTDQQQADVIIQERRKLLEAKMYQLVKALTGSKFAATLTKRWSFLQKPSTVGISFDIVPKNQDL